MGAEAPVVTTDAASVPADPAAQSAAPPLQQAAKASGGQPQVRLDEACVGSVSSVWLFGRQLLWIAAIAPYWE